MLQLDNFYKARFVLSKVIRKTELVHTPRINPESDVYLKPECLQKKGCLIYSVYIIIFYVLFLTPLHINAKTDKDTIFYKINEEIKFDTIPYMMKDNHFLSAYKDLTDMLNGKSKYSFKKAEFLVENAYEEGSMNYNRYCQDIDSVASILRSFIFINNISNYRTAPNYALFEYFTKPSPLNENKAFTYDFEDFCGKKDFRKMFATKVMKTHTGQCTSLPIYYKILCDELGGQSALAMAPRHMYIKHIGEDGKWINIELTNGHFVRDIWLIQTHDISTEAIRNGVFLTALSDKENVAFMLCQLAKAYQQKYQSWDTFCLKCADTVLKVLPHFCDALVVKFNVHQTFGNAYVQRYGRVPSHFIKNNHQETDLSALQNFHNVNVYGQSSYSYPSIYTNRRETNLNMIQGTFSYPTYMVGGYKGDGARAFFQGVPSPSMRKSNNGHGHLGGYYQRGRRY